MVSQKQLGEFDHIYRFPLEQSLRPGFIAVRALLHEDNKTGSFVPDSTYGLQDILQKVALLKMRTGRRYLIEGVKANPSEVSRRFDFEILREVSAHESLLTETDTGDGGESERNWAPVTPPSPHVSFWNG